jgi:hypothetical protein
MRWLEVNGAPRQVNEPGKVAHSGPAAADMWLAAPGGLHAE